MFAALNRNGVLLWGGCLEVSISSGGTVLQSYAGGMGGAAATTTCGKN